MQILQKFKNQFSLAEMYWVSNLSLRELKKVLCENFV